MKKKLLLLSCFTLLFSANANAEIKRKAADDNFPISTVVSVPSDATVYYFSGVVPPLLEDGTYGKDTETQTVGIMNSITKMLADEGLTLSDVIKMQVFLVADPNLKKMDFTGFMKGYTQFYGENSEAKLPVRSAFEVKGLALPEWLIEIEVVAAKNNTP